MSTVRESALKSPSKEAVSGSSFSASKTIEFSTCDSVKGKHSEEEQNLASLFESDMGSPSHLNDENIALENVEKVVTDEDQGTDRSDFLEEYNPFKMLKLYWGEGSSSEKSDTDVISDSDTTEYSDNEIYLEEDTSTENSDTDSLSGEFYLFPTLCWEEYLALQGADSEFWEQYYLMQKSDDELSLEEDNSAEK